MDLNALAQTSYVIASEKGWWETPRSFAGIILLMHSEISEALEEYRVNKGLNEVWYEKKVTSDGISYTTAGEPGDKPCGIPTELADVIIRICDYAGSVNIDLNARSQNLNPYLDGVFEDALARASSCISKAWDAWDGGAKWLIGDYLARAAGHILATCNANGIEIEKAIEEKTAFNRTRPHRHGGKKI